jgi:hypothetical protein
MWPGNFAMAEGVDSALVRQRLVRVLLAGVISGAMTALPGALPIASVMLVSLLATLPLLIYGLRFGWQAAAMAGVAGWGVHGVLSALSGVLPSGQIFFSAGTLVYLLWSVAPALLASALVSRQVRPALLLGVLAGCGAAGAAVVAVAVPELGQLWQETTAALSAQISDPEAQQIAADARLAEMGTVLPGILGSVWLLAFVFNLALASRFLHVAGFGVGIPGFRDLRATEWGVIAAVLCLTAGGLMGSWPQVALMFSNAGLVLLAAVFLGGLALVHDRAARFARPGMTLMLFYMLALFLAVPFLIVLLVGAADAFFDFRNSSFRSRS